MHVDLRGGVEFDRFTLEAYVRNLTNTEGVNSLQRRSRMTSSATTCFRAMPSGLRSRGRGRSACRSVPASRTSMIDDQGDRRRRREPVPAVTARLALPQPYLLFLGDTVEAGFAKTAFGLRDWAPELCVGEFALPSATISLGLPKLHPAEAADRGARALVIGVANSGGFIAEYLGSCPRRSARGGARHRQRHACEAQPHSRASLRRRTAQAAS